MPTKRNIDRLSNLGLTAISNLFESVIENLSSQPLEDLKGKQIYIRIPFCFPAFIDENDLLTFSANIDAKKELLTIIDEWMEGSEELIIFDEEGNTTKLPNDGSIQIRGIEK